MKSQSWLHGGLRLKGRRPCLRAQGPDHHSIHCPPRRGWYGKTSLPSPNLPAPASSLRQTHTYTHSHLYMLLHTFSQTLTLSPTHNTLNHLHSHTHTLRLTHSFSHTLPAPLFPEAKVTAPEPAVSLTTSFPPSGNAPSSLVWFGLQAKQGVGSHQKYI